jgi:hypothetical protein
MIKRITTQYYISSIHFSNSLKHFLKMNINILKSIKFYLSQRCCLKT